MGLLDKLTTGLSNGDFDLAMGLLSAAGPSVQPRGFGQVLAEATQFASDRDRARARNEFVRMHMESAKRKQKAMQKLPQVMSSPTVEGTPFATGNSLLGTGTAPLMTAEQKNSRVMETLAEAAPEQMTAGLFGQMFPSQSGRPGIEQKVAALASVLDRQPTEDEVLSLAGVGGSGDIGDLLKRYQVFEYETKFAKEAEEKERNLRSVKVNLGNTIKRADKMLGYLDKLEGTALATGSTGLDLRKGAVALQAEIESMFGKDSAESRSLVSALDSFNKEASGFAIDLLDSLQSVSTNKTFDVLRESIASAGISPQSNRRVIAEVIQSALDEAEIQGIEIPNKDIEAAQKVMQRIMESEMRFDSTGFGSPAQNSINIGGVKVEFDG